MIPSSQFGSTCGDTKYETEAHTVTLTTDIKPNEKTKIFVNAMLSDVVSKISNFVPAGMATTDAVLMALYSIDNLALYPEYSALHYQQGEVNLGCTYNFTPALYTTAQAGFKVFGDLYSSSSNIHPYGDQTGTVYSGSLGLGYKF